MADNVAIIRVGGATEVEVKERRDRVKDVRHATRAAVDERNVAGGGLTAIYAGNELQELNPENDDQKVGIDSVHRALQAPAKQIRASAGAKGSVGVGKLLEKDDPRYGFDAQFGEYVDMMKVGIMDPLKVLRFTLKGQLPSPAFMIITEAVVAQKVEKSG